MTDRQEYKNDWQNRVRQRNRQIVDSYMSSNPCEYCDYSYPIRAMVLIPGANGGLPHRGYLHNLSKDNLLKELDKLTLLCVLCNALREES